MEGVINLRNKVVSIINLKKKLGFHINDIGDNSKIIMLEGNNIGLMVDEVKEIVNVEKEKLESEEKPLRVKA